MGILKNYRRRRALKVIGGEMDISRFDGNVHRDWTLGLRTIARGLRRTFWPKVPDYAGTEIDYNRARQLYRNDARETNLGSGFCKPMIDGQVQFIGVPHAATGDEIIDEFLNGCLHEFWKPQIQEAIRNALRDSRTIVRYRGGASNDPLVTPREAQAGWLEVVNPESCTLFYEFGNARRVEKAYVAHKIEEQDGTEPTTAGVETPRMVEKTIIEIVTPTEYRYFDNSNGEEREDMRRTNTWGFVPFREMFNEYDSTLLGGQSEFESVYPFIRAFHEVMGQTLMAHKAHATPKAYFKVNEVMTFIASNFPDAFDQIDEHGEPVIDSFNGKVSWQGTEIVFLAADEDAGYLEVKSIIGDSKGLLEFLFDCICIASETPKWVFMQNEQSGNADPLKSLTWVRKIERKRTNFEQDIQFICKMALAAANIAPDVPKLDWPVVDIRDQAAMAQSFNQTTAALELATQRKLISDDTSRAHLKRFIPEMKSPAEEKAAAASNVDLLAATAQPNKTTATGSKAGGGKNE